MALKGKSPTKTEKRLKALFYGMAGVGKTTAAIQFPCPYLIDTEKGSVNDQYVDIINKNQGAVFQTTDFDELLSEVTALLTEDHPYKTVIIDPLTTVYNDLLETSAIKVGTEFGRHYAEANKKMKRLMNLLIRLDMNVIITSHGKNEYGKDMAVLGETFDCYKKLDYLFDLVFNIKKQGNKRVAMIKKSRIEKFPDSDAFEFSYDKIADRYGRDILERDAVSETLATGEQVKQLSNLIKLMNISEETTVKWLNKSNSETFFEMPFDSIQKCIDHLLSKIENKPDLKLVGAN